MMTKTAYARSRGIDPALITRRIADGLLVPRGSRKMLDPVEADQAMSDALGKPRRRGSTAARPGSGRRGSKMAGLTLHQARTLKAREDAERAAIAKEREAIELAELKRAMVAISDVATVWGGELAVLRARLLAIPPRLALQVAAEPDAKRCFSLLQSAINEALRELSESYNAQATAEGGK